MKLLQLTITTLLLLLIAGLFAQPALAQFVEQSNHNSFTHPAHDLVTHPDFFQQGREKFETEIDLLYDDTMRNEINNASDTPNVSLKITFDPQAEIQEHLRHIQPNDLRTQTQPE